ncbi:helix-turn-helix domain-containing protein [Streptomyces decoyicus]|uniref:helix-turn-helix domain-containing protein n=1 Tax=Streptomyces decoyicus TaxID=249567 RepID=UPI00382C52DE
MMLRRLGGALKTPRQRTGMNLDDAAARIGLPSGTTLGKVENAKRLVSTTALDAYFTAYCVGEEDARREEIRKLATLAGSTRPRQPPAPVRRCCTRSLSDGQHGSGR